MGDADKKGVAGGSAPLIIAAVLVAAGFIAKQFELESRRPTQSERTAHYSQPLQTVPARLWQDPMAAIGSLRGKSSAPGVVVWYSPAEIVDQFVKDYPEARQINVILVPVFSGPYAEYGEGRRRQRYAIASGLLESDFAPADVEKLGVLRHWFSDSEELFDIPFEWYSCKKRESQKCGKDVHALVMWINDDLLGVNPLAKLESLYPKNGKGGSYHLRRSVIGPAGSGTLIAMVKEARQARADQFKGLRVFSPNATIDPQALLRAASVQLPEQPPSQASQDSPPPGPWQQVQNQFARAGVTFVSSIGTDQQAAAMLAREATLRQYSMVCLGRADCLDSRKVLVIAEGDTEYAYALANSFAESLLETQCRGKDDDCPGKVQSRVFRLTYLRGLDGETARAPGDEGDKDTKRPSGRPDARSQEYPIELMRAGETAAGNAQYDYLRRLARSAKSLERAASRQRPGFVHAIAIFGSDAYDKLLVMQALRSEFPSAYFMTTDMDARYLQREQLEWSRNLIVASSYELELSKELRGHSAPFRDGYQSAQFVAARLAATNADECAQGFLDSRLARPRLVEISNNGPVRLNVARPGPATDEPLLRRAVHKGAAAEPWGRAGAEPARGGTCDVMVHKQLGMTSVHPETAGGWPRHAGAIFVALTAIVLLAMWYSLTVRRALRRLARGLLMRWPEIVTGFGIVLFVCLPPENHFAFALSVGVTLVVAVPGAAMLVLSPARRSGSWITAVRLVFGSTLAVLAAMLFFGAWTGKGPEGLMDFWAWLDRGPAWPAAVLAFPAAVAAGLLSHPRACRRIRRRRGSARLIVIAVAVLLLSALFMAALTASGEEPVGFLNGASSWPSEALRAAALVFNLWAIAHVFGRLRTNSREVHEKFFRGQPFPVPPPPSVLAILRSPRKRLLEEWRGTDFMKPGGPDPAELWGTYMVLCAPRRLACRSMVGAFLFFAIFVALTAANPIVQPVRGIWSTLADTFLLMASVFTFFYLIFLVVDVVRLTAKFVHFQSKGETHWPSDALPKVTIEHMERVLRDTTDLVLLSRRTEAVSKLVILPFVPLLLLGLARHEVVDAWAWTWPMVLLFGLCFAFLIWMSVELRRAAEQGKNQVLTRLSKERLKALGNKDATAAHYLENVIRELAYVSSGAYSPFWQADWLRGLAIPTTGYGALELLRGFGAL